MKNEDLSKFATLLTGIGELYGKTMSELLMDLYWQALKHFELQDVQGAFEIHVHNPDGGQFFPKPADIVRLIEGNGETKALQAWAKVEKAIVQVGGYQSVVFDDPLIHAVIEDMGGWVKLCSIKNQQMPFVANEFQKRYMGFVLKTPARYPKYLCGITEGENGKNGFCIEAPVLLGDVKQAQAVLNSGSNSSRLLQHSSQVLVEDILKLSKFPVEEKQS